MDSSNRPIPDASVCYLNYVNRVRDSLARSKCSQGEKEWAKELNSALLKLVRVERVNLSEQEDPSGQQRRHQRCCQSNDIKIPVPLLARIRADSIIAKLQQARLEAEDDLEVEEEEVPHEIARSAYIEGAMDRLVPGYQGRRREQWERALQEDMSTALHPVLCIADAVSELKARGRPEQEKEEEISTEVISHVASLLAHCQLSRSIRTRHLTASSLGSSHTVTTIDIRPSLDEDLSHDSTTEKPKRLASPGARAPPPSPADNSTPPPTPEPPGGAHGTSTWDSHGNSPPCEAPGSGSLRPGVDPLGGRCKHGVDAYLLRESVDSCTVLVNGSRCLEEVGCGRNGCVHVDGCDSTKEENGCVRVDGCDSTKEESIGGAIDKGCSVGECDKCHGHVDMISREGLEDHVSHMGCELCMVSCYLLDRSGLQDQGVDHGEGGFGEEGISSAESCADVAYVRKSGCSQCGGLSDLRNGWKGILVERSRALRRVAGFVLYGKQVVA